MLWHLEASWAQRGTAPPRVSRFLEIANSLPEDIPLICKPTQIICLERGSFSKAPQDQLPTTWDVFKTQLLKAFHSPTRSLLNLLPHRALPVPHRPWHRLPPTRPPLTYPMTTLAFSPVALLSLPLNLGTFPQAQQSNIQQINISRWEKKRANINSYTYAQSRCDGHRKANAGTLWTIISPVPFTPWLALRTASNNEWSYSR